MSDRPLVIAHRGASGYLPEHTREAKTLAHAQGADFLEQDIVSTRDGQLVVCHDIFLDRVTNVRKAYAGRGRADGRHYLVDFDWDEIRRLEVVLKPHERVAQAANGPYRLCTLEEEIRLVQTLNRETGRLVGIYPEIKKPGWHRKHGFDVAQSLLDLLERHGYRKADDAVFVQCFDAGELERIRRDLSSELRLVQLVGRSTNTGLLSRRGLARVAEYATALGPNYRQLLRPGKGGQAATTTLVSAIRTAGLELHPYTFNREDLPAFAPDLEGLLALVYDLVDPDAVFSDYPDVAVGIRGQAGSHRRHL